MGVLAGTINTLPPAVAGVKGEVSRGAGFISVVFAAGVVAAAAAALDLTASASCFKCSNGTRRCMWVGSLG